VKDQLDNNGVVAWVFFHVECRWSGGEGVGWIGGLELEVGEQLRRSYGRSVEVIRASPKVLAVQFRWKFKICWLGW
jgi:hypothetical protein